MSLNIKYITIEDVSRILQISKELIWTQLIKTDELRPMIFSELFKEYLYIDEGTYDFFYEQDENHADVMFLHEKNSDGQYVRINENSWDNIKKKKLLFDIEDLKELDINLTVDTSPYPDYFFSNHNFTVITFRDLEYTFNDNQAKAIKYLVKCWKEGKGAIHFSELFEKGNIAVSEQKITKLFDGNRAAFSKLIKSHGKKTGLYSINF